MAEDRSRALALALWLALVVLSAQGASARAPSAGFWSPLDLESTSHYGAYAVRVWRDPGPEAGGLCGVVTIERGGTTLIFVDDAAGLGTLTGTDIDGSGWPNVLVETYTGGAHCCFATRVFDLGDAFVELALPPSPGGNAGAMFVDLDGDGAHEVMTADDAFAYAYCCYACSPAVRVVLALDAARLRYVPASFRFPALYAADIAEDVTRAARAAAGAEPRCGWDGTPKCEILPLVLDYLYSGDRLAARRALDTFYADPDRDAFWAEIEATIATSPYYAPNP